MYQIKPLANGNVEFPIVKDTTPKTPASVRTVPFGETLYQALKHEKAEQLKNEMKYGEYYTIHVMKKEVDEKGNDMIRVVPVQKCVDSQLQRVRQLF